MHVPWFMHGLPIQPLISVEGKGKALISLCQKIGSKDQRSDHRTPKAALAFHRRCSKVNFLETETSSECIALNCVTSIKVWVKSLPLQLNPSPLYPCLHWHKKLPTVLWQSASAWHLGVTRSHSFTSKDKKTTFKKTVQNKNVEQIQIEMLLCKLGRQSCPTLVHGNLLYLSLTCTLFTVGSLVSFSTCALISISQIIAHTYILTWSTTTLIYFCICNYNSDIMINIFCRKFVAYVMQHIKKKKRGGTFYVKSVLFCHWWKDQSRSLKGRNSKSNCIRRGANESKNKSKPRKDKGRPIKQDRKKRKRILTREIYMYTFTHTPT